MSTRQNEIKEDLLRESKPTPLKKSNGSKADSYNEAWARIKKSNKTNFFLEAITIQKSIISDRLLSYFYGKEIVKLRKDDGRYHDFRFLIKESKKAIGNIDKSLFDVIDEWRDSRNKLIHSLVKSDLGTPTKPVAKFLSLAKQTAMDGSELAKEIQKWYTREKRKQIRIKIAY